MHNLRKVGLLSMQDNICVFPSRYTVEAEHLSDWGYSNLPMPLTPFIGREPEIQAACALLRLPEVRLLTLVGTGGIGKTRLALQIMAKLWNDFANGMYFISLANVNYPHEVLSTIADTLNLGKDREREHEENDMQLLKTFLRDQQLLLLLDNFEQVVAAAPLLVELLQVCPQLKMLVTSRTVLHVSGEHEFLVPPLALPPVKPYPDDPALLGQYAAVALFMQRARAIKPDFQCTQADMPIIAEICTRVDGLPLAIELAASRIKLFPPQTLLTMLKRPLQLLSSKIQDAPARQQTLRNTLTWSYNLLPMQEQGLFRRLAVFVGGCSLEAAATVSTVINDLIIDVVDGVASLLDKSLLWIQSGLEPRLRFLETTREYGLERLLASGELEIMQQAHATYYLTLAEEAVPHLHGAKQARYFEQLDQEYENLMVALRWSIERGKEGVERSLRLSGALALFWWLRGHFQEGKNILEQALAKSGESMGVVRAKALYEVANVALSQKDFLTARQFYTEGLALFLRGGDEEDREILSCLEGLVRVALGQHQPAWAARLAGMAEMFRETLGVNPAEPQAYEKLLQTIRAQLGPQTFTALWAEGRTMTLENVLTMQEYESLTDFPSGGEKPSGLSALTEREIEVLRLLVDGLTNNKIAEQLIISPHTVNAHVRSIFNKLDVNSRSALTRFALEQNLI